MSGRRGLHIKLVPPCPGQQNYLGLVPPAGSLGPYKSKMSEMVIMDERLIYPNANSLS